MNNGSALFQCPHKTSPAHTELNLQQQNGTQPSFISSFTPVSPLLQQVQRLSMERARRPYTASLTQPATALLVTPVM